MRVGLLVLGLGALAACGEATPPPSAEHVAFVEACAAAGAAAELCECRATRLDELTAAGEVSDDVRRAYLLQEQGKEDEAQAIMETLPPSVLFNQPSAIAEAEQQCHAPG